MAKTNIVAGMSVKRPGPIEYSSDSHHCSAELIEVDIENADHLRAVTQALAEENLRNRLAGPSPIPDRLWRSVRRNVPSLSAARQGLIAVAGSKPAGVRRSHFSARSYPRVVYLFDFVGGGFLLDRYPNPRRTGDGGLSDADRA